MGEKQLPSNPSLLPCAGGTVCLKCGEYFGEAKPHKSVSAFWNRIRPFPSVTAYPLSSELATDTLEFFKRGVREFKGQQACPHVDE